MSATGDEVADSSHEHASRSHSNDLEVHREGATMLLYVSIVLLATLAALPSGTEEDPGIHGVDLLGVIWGTTVGLALTHWFAFNVAARAFGAGRLNRQDGRLAMAQIGGAALVAIAASVPVLLFRDHYEVGASTFVPAIIVGGAGYLTAHAAGRSRSLSIMVGVVVLVLGLVVAGVKNLLSGH